MNDKNQLELTKPAEVADLFVATCQRLRELGATHVSGFGLSAHFGPPSAPRPTKDNEPSKDPLPELGVDAQELQARAAQLAGGRA